MGWPFPAPLEKPYIKLFQELSTLGPDIYVYPYNQTHITVMTIVNFKKHQYPGKEIKKVEKLVREIIDLVSKELATASRHAFKPFKIGIGPPVLLKRAAILPILNPTKEVFYLREMITTLLENALDLKVEVPRCVHSTIVRFLKSPSDVNKFIQNFELIASDTRLGEATIDELLLTSETKPYMRGGEILHYFRHRN